MHETPSVTPTDTSFKLFTVVCLLLVVAAIGWLAYRVETKPTASTDATSQTDTSSKTPDTANGGWNTTVTSGNDAFTVILPDGWGPLINPKNTDLLLLSGMTQPDVAVGNKTVVTTPEGHGGDSPSVFSIVLMDQAVVTPRGTATEFVLGKGEEAITGTKYAYRYEQDDIVGVGTQRLVGDRDYQYVFPVGGKELHVHYSVYGSDPRNLVTTVDQIVHTLTIKQ